MYPQLIPQASSGTSDQLHRTLHAIAGGLFSSCSQEKQCLTKILWYAAEWDVL